MAVDKLCNQYEPTHHVTPVTQTSVAVQLTVFTWATRWVELGVHFVYLFAR